MRAEILIAGQGVAGTLLGWELEQAGVPFLIRDPGHETAATAAAAGIINPVTGRRLVKTWRFDELHPMAAAMWRELGGALGERLWREMRVRREFADEEEREAWKRKAATAELSPYAGAPFDDGFWIVGAARVDLAAALARELQRKRGFARGGRTTDKKRGGRRHRRQRHPATATAQNRSEIEASGLLKPDTPSKTAKPHRGETSHGTPGSARAIDACRTSSLRLLPRQARS